MLRSLNINDIPQVQISLICVVGSASVISIIYLHL